MLLAELRKLTSLPSVGIGAIIGVVVPAALTVLASRQAAYYGTHSDADDGYQQLIIIGTVSAIIVGVVAVSSEYGAEDSESGGGRPITTALLVHPRRITLLLSKTSAVGIVVMVLAVAATALALVARTVAFSDFGSTLNSSDLSRGFGVVIYWVLTSWIAQGIALLTRSGIVPLAILIVNSSVVPFTYLLSQVISVANYLPDRAGYSLVIQTQPTSLNLTPIAGGLVMLAWTIGILAAGAVAFYRRDA